MEQKFHKGDLVRIADDLGPHMSHFTSSCDAIVLYSYNDEYGGGNIDDYSIYIQGKGSVAWYDEYQLSLIKSGQHDLLNKWQSEADSDREEKSNLNWIFANGKDVVEHGFGSSIGALAKCLGLNDLWGSRGEGMTYYINSLATLNLAKHFLISGDKDGYVKMANEIKDNNPTPINAREMGDRE